MRIFFLFAATNSASSFVFCSHSLHVNARFHINESMGKATFPLHVSGHFVLPCRCSRTAQTPSNQFLLIWSQWRALPQTIKLPYGKHRSKNANWNRAVLKIYLNAWFFKMLFHIENPALLIPFSSTRERYTSISSVDIQKHFCIKISRGGKIMKTPLSSQPLSFNGNPVALGRIYILQAKASVAHSEVSSDV